MAAPIARPKACLYVATYTPYDEKLQLKLELIPKYVDHLVKNKVEGVYVNGSTGEFPNLNVDERKAIQAKWLECAKGKLEAVIHIGSANVNDAIELAKHAREHGAKAVAAVMPYYYSNTNVENAVEVLAAIGAAVPDIALLYYHIPLFTYTTYTLYDVLTAARGRVPNLVGAKWTDDKTPELLRCTELVHPDGEPYLLLPGFEHVMAENSTTGTRGAVYAMLNWMPAEFLGLREAFQAGKHDEVRHHSLRILKAKQVLIKFGAERDGQAALKDAMRVVGRRVFGFDVGTSRLPARGLPDDQLIRMEKAFEEIGLFDWNAVEKV